MVPEIRQTSKAVAGFPASGGKIPLKLQVFAQPACGMQAAFNTASV